MIRIEIDVSTPTSEHDLATLLQSVLAAINARPIKGVVFHRASAEELDA